ncbi:MAG TPA: MBL fold metallo-hydrolase [Bacillales bacterium]|nr:MBL fold metallo-hydrolase [Bacillales bacterium]
MADLTFSNKHFKLEKLRDGIYAAIAKPEGGAVGNAGFIDLGGRTLVFDTFNTHQAAEDLRWVAEKVTGCSVSWVINSHWHGDHIRGKPDVQGYIPEEKIAFMADLLFVESHPSFFDDSDLAGWSRILKEVGKMESDIAVSGHGVVGAKKDIAKMITYIQDMKKMVKEGRAPGEVEMPEKYKSWAAPEVFKQNLEIAQKATTCP